MTVAVITVVNVLTMKVFVGYGFVNEEDLRGQNVLLLLLLRDCLVNLLSSNVCLLHHEPL